jgi:NADPH:quinone reductase-like Zn-dependent oxidoreductase
VPDGVSADEAETLIVNGLTAYQMLHRNAKVRAGQTVLVLGASGGVGTILVQLARHAGARVIGTASPRHHDALRALGVEPVDYRDPDLAARVRELARDGVDAVFDHLGGASVTRSYRLLNRTGTLVSYSIASKLDDTGPLLPGFLRLLAKLAPRCPRTPRRRCTAGSSPARGDRQSPGRPRGQGRWRPGTLGRARTSPACAQNKSPRCGAGRRPQAA